MKQFNYHQLKGFLQSLYLSVIKNEFYSFCTSILCTKVAPYNKSVRHCRSNVSKGGSFLLALMFCMPLLSQEWKDLKTKKGKNAFNESFFTLYARYTMLNGKYTEPAGGLTGNVTLIRNRQSKGELRYRFENSLIGDLLYVVAKEGSALLNNRLPAANKTEQNFSSGWLGWHKAYINVSSKPKYIISAGLSYGDYIFGSKRLAAGSPSARIQEPAGYYFYVGPAVMASFVLSKKFWLDAYANYDINLTKAAKPSSGYTEIPGYPMPKNLVLGADLYCTKKLHAGIRYNHLMDNGSQKDRATRIDINIGFLLTH
jgi:hypothetical protein